MICKRCKNELPDNSRFCMACGALQPMVCPACQSESRPGSRVCSGCGKKLPVTYSGVTFYKRKKTPAQIAAMVLLVLGALLVLTAAVMFLMGTINEVTEPPAEEEITEVDNRMDEEEFTVIVEEPITKPLKDPETAEKPADEEETTEELPEETPGEEPEETSEEETKAEDEPAGQPEDESENESDEDEEGEIKAIRDIVAEVRSLHKELLI